MGTRARARTCARARTRARTRARARAYRARRAVKDKQDSKKKQKKDGKSEPKAAGKSMAPPDDDDGEDEGGDSKKKKAKDKADKGPKKLDARLAIDPKQFALLVDHAELAGDDADAPVEAAGGVAVKYVSLSTGLWDAARIRDELFKLRGRDEFASLAGEARDAA